MILTAVVVVALSIPSDPFVRSRVKPGTVSDHCLYWPGNQALTWHAEQTGNLDTPGTTEFDAMRAAFGTWNAQFDACGSIKFVEGAQTSSRFVGYLKSASQVSSNENILLFRTKSCGSLSTSDPCWNSDDPAGECGNKYDCWEHQTAAIALTTTTYDPQSGEILDADVEFNAAASATAGAFLFTTVDSPRCVAPNYATNCVAWDIQNTLTHEIGHFLGLDHTAYPGSTMNPTAPPGETSKRTLDDGTKSFVCAAYPKGQVARDCVIRPYGGSLGDAKMGCATAGGALLGLTLLPLLGLLRRRRA